MNKVVRGALWAGAAVAVPAAINAIISARAGEAEQPLPGDIAYYDWTYGRVAFYRLGMGDPLLLVHNPHAGGSAWEWRAVFPELANHFTVYAIDLLGYGLSDKPNLPYSGALFADLVHDFLEDVIPAPARAVGSALGCSYLVNAAVRRPELLSHLLLVNPTGHTRNYAETVAGAIRTGLRLPVLGTSFYNAIVSGAGIQQELRQHDYFDPTFVTPEMVQSLYTLAHQPGSQYAAAAFIAGYLDLPMRMAFADITQPTLLVWGRDAYYTPVEDAMDLLYRHPEARLQIIDECGMLPHDEKAGDFLQYALPFLRTEEPRGEERAA